MEEIWKDVVNYELRYEVSNFGNVRSRPYSFVNRAGRVHRVSGQIIKSKISKGGYKRLFLSKEGLKQKHVCIHRLVASAFIPNPRNLPDINHKNCIKTDNRVENLEWVTPMQNKHHWMASDVYTPPNQGEKNTFCKLTTENVLTIKHLRKTTSLSARELGLKFGVTRGHIFRILSGAKWKHLT